MQVLPFQDFEQAEQQAKERRVADAELAATQVLQSLVHTCICILAYAYLLMHKCKSQQGMVLELTLQSL